MRLDHFDLNLLVALDVLLEERSVTRAARRLNVTQSAMSAALKRLREAFQDELLVLHGKRMVPTPHALTLAPEVGTAIARLRSLIATGTGFDPATSKRRFRVDASDYITTVLLAPLIGILHEQAPGIRLDLALPSSDSSRRMEDGEVDLLITPDEFMEPDHPRELLFEERHVVVGWKDNPIFNRELTVDDYLASGHVAVRIFDRDTFIESILSKQAPDRQIEVIAQSFIQVPWLLRGTRRLSVMHERLAKVAAPVFDLAFADAPLVLPVMREMMQYHVTRSSDAGLVWLRDRLKLFAQAA
jgi:LysR family transcriptional regulator, nod-box dependent transcriptional activator